MKSTTPFIARLLLTLSIPGLALSPSSMASLSLYDASIATDHGGGAGSLPYAATLTTPEVFDGLAAAPFDFGSLTGPATIELIIEGDPVAGGQNGYIGQGSNGGNSLRFEQWNDTGTMGFTRSGVADYDLLFPSPTEPTHVVYRWDGTSVMDLYVDGALTGTVTDATFEMPTGAGLLGNVSDGGGEGMIGTIHRITTYDSSLDEATILRHANAWLSTGDPDIQLPPSFTLDLDGSVQSFEFPIFNGGEDNTLTIEMVEAGGADGGKVTIDTPRPISIDPGGSTTLAFTFDPMGATGTVEAFITFFSNDILNDEASVSLTGLIRDPQISVASALDLGISNVAVTQMLEVQNLGANQPLTLSSIQVTGADADKFGATGPASIPAGGSGNVEVTFDPGGGVGGFLAQLEIGSDDPGNALAIVDLSAIAPIDEGFLTAYDSVISADHGNGVGAIPHQALLTTPTVFDGTNSIPFDFGEVTGDATFEFILQGDPVGGGRDGFLGVGTNGTFSLRYEQWDDTGQLGFTHGGVADYVFTPTGDAELVNSPTEVTHVAYQWQSALQTMNLYIDGDLAGSNMGSSIEMPTGAGFLGNNAGGSEGMIGTIHRVTIYNNDIGGDNVQRHALAFVTGAGAADFDITAVAFDPLSEMVTFTWNSTQNAIYAVDKSFDLAAWEELDDGVFADGPTTEYSASGALPEGETKVYFRVRLPE